ncbi:MAG: hypothetical protein PHW04_07950 [Candidatus Wallbacteria bacterium]|nr:hypothetical protein [Candidatus Wallbacteria bacterium]
MEDLRTELFGYYRRYLWLSSLVLFLAMLPVIAIMFYFHQHNQAFLFSAERLKILRSALLLLTIVEFATARFLKKKLLSSMPAAENGLMPLIRKLYTASFLSVSLAVTPFVMGAVMFIFTGDRFDLEFFWGITLIFAGLNFTYFDEWWEALKAEGIVIQ